MLNSTLETKLCAVLLNLYSIDQAGSIILLLVMISAEDASRIMEFLRSNRRLHTFSRSSMGLDWQQFWLLHGSNQHGTRAGEPRYKQGTGITSKKLNSGMIGLNWEKIPLSLDGLPRRLVSLVRLLWFGSGHCWRWMLPGITGWCSKIHQILPYWGETAKKY